MVNHFNYNKRHEYKSCNQHPCLIDEYDKILMDVADKYELKADSWKGRFPYYVVFSDDKVINVLIENGIPLVDLYNSVGEATFPMLRKRKTVNQRQLQSMHYRRSHMQITQKAYTFLMDELNKHFTKFKEVSLG